MSTAPTPIPNLPLATVAEQAGVCHATAWRWRAHGVEVNGRRVKLKAVRVGAVWRTRAEWLADFLAAMNEPAEAEPAVVRTPATARRAGEAAAKRLEAMGL